MADPPSTSSEVNETVGAVEVRMEDAPTKMDAEKTNEVPNASEKAVEKPVEATDTDTAPIQPVGAMTSSVEPEATKTSSAKLDDVTGDGTGTGAPIVTSQSGIVPNTATTVTDTPSTSETSKAGVGMPESSTTPATVKSASASNDTATSTTTDATTLVAIAPTPQPETSTATATETLTTTKPTIVAPQSQPAFTKKRKAPSVNSTTTPVTGTTTTAAPKQSSSSSTLITSRPPVSSPLPSMADYPVVAQTVKDIFTLLETCTYIGIKLDYDTFLYSYAFPFKEHDSHLSLFRSSYRRWSFNTGTIGVQLAGTTRM
jgi:hypothetical protein